GDAAGGDGGDAAGDRPAALPVRAVARPPAVPLDEHPGPLTCGRRNWCRESPRDDREQKRLENLEGERHETRTRNDRWRHPGSQRRGLAVGCCGGPVMIWDSTRLLLVVG